MQTQEQQPEHFGPITVSPKRIEGRLYWSAWRMIDGARCGTTYKTRKEAVDAATRLQAKLASEAVAWERFRQSLA